MDDEGRKEDIIIDEKEKTVALHLRLSKGDQEGKGLKRTLQLQCCCKDECDWSQPCPFAVTRRALDCTPIEEDVLVHGDATAEISKQQVIESWRKLFGKKVSGHSGGRSGALQYIRRAGAYPK